MLISFSGLDGAGKTTLIECLKETLERQHRTVAVYHMNDHIGVYAYTRAVRDWLRRSLRMFRRPRVDSTSGASAAGVDRSGSAGPQKHPNRMLVRIRNGILWNKLLRSWIYLVDLVIFLCYRVYIEGVRGQVLIMDRYFYDTLVDVADERRWFGLRVLASITPTPQLPILLDITPEESFTRKGEYSVDYLSRRWRAYHKVFPWVRGAVVIANHDLPSTTKDLQRLLMERASRA